MKNKSKKTAVLSVMALLLIMQLVFFNTAKEDKAVSPDVVLDNSENTLEPSDNSSMYTEEVVSTEINVVYRNTVTAKDISVEMEERKNKTDYDNKIVSYTLEELPIYEAEDISSAVVGIMFSGSEGDIIEQGTEWTKITSGEVTGYVRNVDVLFGAEAEVIASVIGDKKAVVTKDNVMVYSNADITSAVISSLAKGAGIDAFEEVGAFTLISCDNGFGYVETSSIGISYGLSKAKSKAELDAIEAAQREEEARRAAELAAKQALAAQQAAQDKAVAQNLTNRGAYTVSAEELHLLAAIIYWESGWEPADGQLAVANVVLNRVFSSRFSQNSIASVVYAPGQFTGVAENGVPSERFQGILNMSNEELNKRGCYDTALRALAGENNIGDMLFFINVKKANFAKYKGYTIINNHCFYTY